MPQGFDGVLNPINASTRRFIANNNGRLLDGTFQQDPLLAHLRANATPFTGGRNVQVNFVFDGLVGGAYDGGEEQDTSEKQVEQGMQFLIKRYYVNITLDKFDIQVLNKGDAALYRLLDTRTTVGYETLGAHVAISNYLGRTSLNGNTKGVVGLAEAANDGTTNSWDGNAYTTYGNLSRTGDYSEALQGHNRVISQALQYDDLEDSYSDCDYGGGDFEPNLGVTTMRGYSAIKKRFQTQQRFPNVQDPKIGFTGLQFNNATILKGRYVPGAAYLGSSSGTRDNNAVTYLKQTTNGAITSYPTVTNETLFWINTSNKRFCELLVTNDAEFGFGFGGYIPSSRNDQISAKLRAAIALLTFPRYLGQISAFS